MNVFPPGYPRRLIAVSIALQVSQESVLRPVPLLLRERTPLIGEQVGERGEEVLTLGFQALLLRIRSIAFFRILRFLIPPLGRGGRLAFSILAALHARTTGRIRVTFPPASLPPLIDPIGLAALRFHVHVRIVTVLVFLPYFGGGRHGILKNTQREKFFQSYTNIY